MNVSLEGMTPDEIANLASLAKAQMDNPRTRIHFLRNSKVVDPSLSIPEVDIPEGVNQMFAKSQEQMQALAQENANLRLERDIEKRREKLMQKHGLSETQVEEVEKMMLEKQIASHDTAAEFYKSQQQSAMPTPSTYSVNTMPKIDLKESGVRNMADWSRQQAGRVIDEFRGRIKVT